MFTVTYEIVTPESAEHADADERGFVLPGGWQVELSKAMNDRDGVYTMTLREAVNLMGCCENSGFWFTETDSRHDYRTGAETQFSLHPPKTITGASYSRLARLLGAQ